MVAVACSLGCSLCRWESPECPPSFSLLNLRHKQNTGEGEGNGTKAASSDGGKEGGLFGGLPAFPIAADGSEAEAWREGRGRSAEVGKSTTQSRNGILGRRGGE